MLFLVSSATIRGQNDPCAAVLTATGRNEFRNVQESDLRAYFYKQTCGNKATDPGLSFAAAQTSLGLSYSSRDEYCNAEQSQNAQHYFNYQATSMVVEKSLEA